MKMHSGLTKIYIKEDAFEKCPDSQNGNFHTVSVWGANKMAVKKDVKTTIINIINVLIK